MIHFNLYPAKILSGFLASLMAAFVDNLLPLFLTATVFEFFDFVTGCWKSAIVSHRKKEHFAFESVKAWRTIYKYVLTLVGIMLAELLDHTLADESRLRLANFFTAGVCGVEFWSFLENAAVISNHPVFKWLRKFMKLKVEDTTGLSLGPGRARDKKTGKFVKASK